MKIDELLNEQNKQNVPVQQVRLAIQQGQVDQQIGAKIRDQVRQIIRSHIKDEPDWTVNQWHNDLGLVYYGDESDLDYADAVVDGIVGDIYGFFQDSPRNERTRVAPYQKQVNGVNRTVYKIVPQKGSTQIKFFRVNQIEPGKPVLGLLIDVKE